MRISDLLMKSRFFYGYWIVLVLFYCFFIVAGCGSYIFSIFVLPIQEQFGWGRGDIMLALTLYFLSMGAASPLAGKLVTRYGARRVIALGAFLAGLGFALVPLMQELWHFYCCYVLIGIGIAIMGLVPGTAVVSNWFRKRRGTALGIMSTGIGVGGFVMASVTGNFFIPNFGWQTSFLLVAIITWASIPPVLLIIRTKPEEMGLHPDGITVPDQVTEEKSLPAAASGLSLKAAIGMATFWLITVSFLTNGFSMDGVLHTQVPFLEDTGFPMALASTALGGVGLSSSLGKFFFGWLCDRIPPKYAWFIANILQLSGIIVLINIGPTSSISSLWLYAILFGLGVGGWLPTMSMLTSTSFGLASYAVIFGMVNLAHSIGSAVGPLFAGYMYDATGSYQLAFTIFLVLFAVSIPTVLDVRRARTP